MISTQEALDRILDTCQDFGIEEVSFLKAQNRVLVEDITADRDFPPFNRVSMDGIAIKFSSFEKGKRNFLIENIQAAGSPQQTLLDPDNCIEVMTGAVLPRNTDTVIRYEDISVEDGQAKILLDAVVSNQNVHPKGKDRNQNDILIRKNTLISAAEIGILSTVGKSKVKVAKQPRVIIISTGDELVDVAQRPKQHQIRRSNVYTLISLLKNLNIEAEEDHIIDDKTVLRSKIATYLEVFDALIFSGAVSKGKYDFLPEILEELGVVKLFHRVSQRPGKPFWFGLKEVYTNSPERTSDSKKVSVFAFPGNPVSTFVGCLKYFYPWYKKSVSLPYLNHGKSILGDDFNFIPKLTYFLQVRLDSNGGLKIAKPIVGNGSGDLANLVDADGFLELPPDKSTFEAGETYPLIRYRL